jgi:hypothetical protein
VSTVHTNWLADNGLLYLYKENHNESEFITYCIHHCKDMILALRTVHPQGILMISEGEGFS